MKNHNYLAAVVLVAAGLSSPAIAREVLVLGGASGSSKSQYYYLGAIVPIPQTLAEDGLRVRLWSAWKNFEYTGTAAATKVEVDGPELEGALGYQKMLGKSTFVAGYVGLVWRNLNESPADPSLRHQDGLFAKVQVEGATRSGNFGISAIGSYIFHAKDYWTRVRPAYFVRGSSLQVGPDFVFLGGERYDKQQYGIFVDGISLGAKSSTTVVHSEALGVRLGLEHDSRKGGNRPYAGISFAVKF